MPHTTEDRILIVSKMIVAFMGIVIIGLIGSITIWRSYLFYGATARLHNLSAEHVVSIDVGRHHSTDTASIKEIVHALHTVERFSISEHGRLGPRVPFRIVVRSGEPYRYTVRAYAGTERAVLEVIGDYLGETGVQMQSRTLGAVLKRAGVAVP